jgi:hypothetical protein
MMMASGFHRQQRLEADLARTADAQLDGDVAAPGAAEDLVDERALPHRVAGRIVVEDAHGPDAREPARQVRELGLDAGCQRGRAGVLAHGRAQQAQPGHHVGERVHAALSQQRQAAPASRRTESLSLKPEMHTNRAWAATTGSGSDRRRVTLAG